MHTATVGFNRRSLEVMTLALILCSFAMFRLSLELRGAGTASRAILEPPIVSRFSQRYQRPRPSNQSLAGTNQGRFGIQKMSNLECDTVLRCLFLHLIVLLVKL